MRAELPANEQARLAALQELELLDTLAEPEFDELVVLAAAICGTPISMVSLVDEDRQWFKAAVGVEFRETPRDVAFCAHAILQDSLFTIQNAEEDERFKENPLVTGDNGVRFYAGMPLLSPEGLPVGTLCVIDHVPRSLTPEQNASLQVLGRQINARLELRMQRKRLNHVLVEKQAMLDELQETKTELECANFRLEQLATTDFLTGLRNRRVFDERLSEEFKRARQRSHALSLAIIDIDNFKRRNDLYGHLAGDTALKQLAQVLRSVMRQTDIPVRYGGEEFAILLPNSTTKNARRLADRILAAVHTAVWPNEPLTVSIGIAELDTSIDLHESAIVARADAALYSAKHAGKDRFHVSQVLPATATPAA